MLISVSLRRAVIVSGRDPKQNTSLAVLPYVNHTVEVFDYVFQATVVFIPIYVCVDTALSKKCYFLSLAARPTGLSREDQGGNHLLMSPS
jgi:hypothetical protein